jgi:hypothetical protein
MPQHLGARGLAAFHAVSARINGPMSSLFSKRPQDRDERHCCDCLIRSYHLINVSILMF